MILQISGLNTINFVSVIDTFAIWIIVFVAVIVIGLIAWWLYNYTTYNVNVEIIRQVGSTIDDQGTKHINFKTKEKPGKLYPKKLKSGAVKEYFKIKGTNFDYLNYFDDKEFHMRDRKHVLDFKKLGIKLFASKDRGLIPLRMSNPNFEYAKTSLNTVIGAITDSMKENEALYGDDFWKKYGALITIASLMAFFVIGMIFLIKYQDVFWKNSMSALRQTLSTIKETQAQNLV